MAADARDGRQWPGMDGGGGEGSRWRGRGGSRDGRGARGREEAVEEEAAVEI